MDQIALQKKKCHFLTYILERLRSRVTNVKLHVSTPVFQLQLHLVFLYSTLLLRTTTKIKLCINIYNSRSFCESFPLCFLVLFFSEFSAVHRLWKGKPDKARYCPFEGGFFFFCFSSEYFFTTWRNRNLHNDALDRVNYNRSGCNHHNRNGLAAA